MLYQIVSLLLEVVIGVLSGACLLRLYMQYQRIPLSARSGNPLGGFIFALTDWLVLPLRRLLKASGSMDWASLMAVYLLQLTEFGVLWLLAGAFGATVAVPILAGFGVLRMAITCMTGAVIVHAVLSWVPTQSPMTYILDRLVSPLLRPIRRHLPLLGGIDLSPIVLLLCLQIAAIVLAGLQANLLH